MSSSMPMTPITIEQYLAFEAPAGYRDELLYGRIIVSPDPKPLHLDIAENIFTLLKAALGKKYRVGQRINLRFSAEDSMPSPDVFVIEQKAWNQAALAGEYPDGSQAILVVEVLSPGNRSKNMQLKADLYTSKSAEVWVVDPERQEIKVYRDKRILNFSVKNAVEISLPPNLSKRSVIIATIFDVPYRPAKRLGTVVKS